MAIKRVTIEIDDSQDVSAPTGSLNHPAETEITEPKGKYNTRVPDYAHTEDTELPEEPTLPQAGVGRTYADLIYEFGRKPAAMVTIIMTISFAIFLVGRDIGSVKDLKYPLIIGLILVACWFGIPLLQRFSRLFRR